MGETELGGQRLPGPPEAARPVGLGRKRVQHVEQPVGGVRQGEALGASPLGAKTGRKVGGDTPAEPRIGFGRTAQLGGRVDRHEARGGGNGVAVVVALEQACLCEGVASSGPMEHESPPLGRDPDQFERPVAHHDEAEGKVACAEQSLSRGEATVAAGRQGLAELGVHMTPIIVAALGSALPAPAMNISAAILIAALPCALVSPAASQHAGPHGGHHRHGAVQAGTPPHPYAGLEGRRIKALSEEDAESLLSGHGMGFALAAELNGYPGLVHVLEHAESLHLTSEQRAMAETLRERMAGEARTLGARIVALEGELDRLFANGAADPVSLAALTVSIGALNGRLREVHLAVHIAMRNALEPEQLTAYARLRGYDLRQ